MAEPTPWAGGEHVFALKLGQLRGLQDALDSGPLEILSRLQEGTWRIDDVIEVLNWGLIGGGDIDVKQSRGFVSRIVEGSSKIDCAGTAYTVLAEALISDKGDPVGELEGEKAPPPDDGNLAASTAPAP